MISIQKIKKKIEELCKKIGIDIIPFLFKSLPDNSKEVKYQDIKAKVIKINKEIDKAIIYAKDLLTNENSRCQIIEKKAQNLFSVTGITTGLIVGLASLLINIDFSKKIWQGIIICFLFFSIILSLILTVVLAYKSLKVGDYQFGVLNIDDVYDYSNLTVLEIKKEELSSIIFCCKKNELISNIKATYLINSQKWMRNSIILLLIMSIFLILNVAQNLKFSKDSTCTLDISSVNSNYFNNTSIYRNSQTKTPTSLKTTPTNNIITETPLNTVTPTYQNTQQLTPISLIATP